MGHLLRMLSQKKFICESQLAVRGKQICKRTPFPNCQAVEPLYSTFCNPINRIITSPIPTPCDFFYPYSSNAWPSFLWQHIRKRQMRTADHHLSLHDKIRTARSSPHMHDRDYACIILAINKTRPRNYSHARRIAVPKIQVMPLEYVTTLLPHTYMSTFLFFSNHY